MDDNFDFVYSTNDKPQREPPGPLLRYNSSNHNVVPGPSEGRLAITNSGHNSNVLVLSKDFAEEGTSERAIQRRREQYRQVRAHVQKEDGRLQAYGWSLPGAKASQGQQTNNKHAGGVPVPVPVYCRPLAEASPHMKVWCASGVNLNGGFTKDGGCMIGASVFYSNPSKVEAEHITEIETTAELESLDKQISMSMDSPNGENQLSSYVWICTSTHTASTVTVIDAKNPAEILDSFPVCQTHLLCICTVIGALEKDYTLLENSEVTKLGETLDKPGVGPEDVGRVEFIRSSEKQEKTVVASNNNDNDVNENVTSPEQTPEKKPLNDDAPNDIQTDLHNKVKSICLFIEAFCSNMIF